MIRKKNRLLAALLAMAMIISNFGGITSLTAQASELESEQSAEQMESAEENTAESAEITAPQETELESVAAPADSETTGAEEEEKDQPVESEDAGSEDSSENEDNAASENEEAEEQNAESDRVIASFNYKKIYNYVRGEAPATIDLGAEIEAVVDDEPVDVPVTWTADKVYAPDIEGTYVYTGTISGKYALGEGVDAPKVTINVRAEKNAEKAEIIAFSYEAFLEYTIGKDAPESEAELIKKLGETIAVTVKSEDSEEAEQKEIPVKWNADKEYKKDEAGEYTYTAEIPEEYKVEDGLAVPKVVVRLKEVSKKLEVIAEGTNTVITVEGNFPEGSSLIAAKVENKLSNDMLNASNKLKNFASAAAYDIKVVKDGAKVDLPAGSVAKVTIVTNSEINPDTRLVHVKTDLIDDNGNKIEGISEKVVNDIKAGTVQTEVLTEDDNVQINENTVTFELKSFSTIIAAEPNAITKITKAEISYNGNIYDLTQPSTLPDFGYRDEMTLHVEAQFGLGTEKEISITVPKSLSFIKDAFDTSTHHVVNGTDVTLREKIVSNVSADILGIKQHDGTLTLKFKGDGEDSDTRFVSLDIPIYGAWRNDRNKEVWESGTAWFYDEAVNAVTVSQSIKNFSDVTVKNECTLDKLTFKNDEGKSYGTNWEKVWNLTTKPEVKEGGQMTGSESFWVKPLPGGEMYPSSTAYKKYSITFLAPEFAKFEGFKEAWKGYTPNYKGAPVVETPAGGTTANGYTVPAGYKGYTFTIENDIVSPRDLTVFPMWSFPKDKYPAGTEVTIKVADVKVRYYGREYAANQYENFDENQYPSLTYKVLGDFEEVFARVYYHDKDRETDGNAEADTLYMGAPGFEHTQERYAGHFTLGNRGTKDSKTKTVTITYDVNNTGTIGVTEQRIPGSVAGDHVVSNVYVKTWNSKTNQVSDWIAITPKVKNIYGYVEGTTINLYDLNIEGGKGKEGTYIKSIKFDIDTVPTQSWLSDKPSRNRYVYEGNDKNEPFYKFNAVVLAENAVSVSGHTIEHKIEIANKEGDDPRPQGGDISNGGAGQLSAYTTITGRLFNGLHGKSLIVGNNLAYDAENVFELGSKNNLVISKVHLHEWTTQNAQYMDAIYLISPDGEPYTNITMHYEGVDDKPMRNGKPVDIGAVGKKYYATDAAPQPVITEIPATDKIKTDYPDARVYKLDFTGINTDQARYNTRQIAGNVLSWDSLKNTPLSTMKGSSRYYNGAWISFNYTPKTTTKAQAYEKLMWVEYNTNTNVPIEYDTSNGYRTYLFADEYNLTGTGKMLGRMDTITLKKKEGLIVSSSAKQKKEVDTMYRTYDGTDATVMGMYSDANYKLTVENNSTADVTGFAVYFPVPKAGENWGGRINPDGAFKFSTRLSNALRTVPDGFEVYYAKNASPTAEYGNWEAYTWTKQSDTSGWTASDWNAVNFVKLVWVKADPIKVGDVAQAVFDMTVDTTSVTEDQMYKKNVWSPYFLRKYASSESWVVGEPVATVLTPGMLKGFVWEDSNVDNKLNGKFDEGENPVKGATVELYDTSTGTDVLRAVTQTDETGHYVFDGLKDGTAETEHTVYKIVVRRDDTKYISFTKQGVDMVFTPSTDHAIASLPGLRAASGAEVKMYGTGLVAESVTATTPVVRKFVQGGPANASTFGFMWEADFDNSELPDDMADNEMPMPDGTAANTQETRVYISTANQGESRFGNITFNREGTYSYIIRELNTGQANYRYDEAVYRVVYEVIEVETQNGVREMYVEMSILKNEEVIDDNAGLTFTNVYTAPGGGGGGGGGGTPTKPTPKPTPAAPVTPAGEVLGARRTDPEQQVLGARRGTNKGSVLGARRGKTGEASNASRLMVIAGLSAMIALLARASRRKKED